MKKVYVKLAAVLSAIALFSGHSFNSAAADYYDYDGKELPVGTEFASFERRYEGVARFPAVSRDISMLVPNSVTAGDIEHILLQRGGKLLENFRLFDIYEGAQVQQGYKSMAYALSFRAKDHTLKDDEINSVMKKILNGLNGLGCELRS